MKKTVLWSLCAVLAATVLTGCHSRMSSVPNGFVPDIDYAIKLAEIYLPPIYGQEMISQQLPLHGILKDDRWIISGTVRTGVDDQQIEIVIDRVTGEVHSVKPYVDFAKKVYPARTELKSY